MQTKHRLFSLGNCDMRVSKIMRLSLILLLVSLRTSFAAVGDNSFQRTVVNIDVENVFLSAVLSEIENQTDYLFIYDQEINTEVTVSVKAKNASVPEVMSKIGSETGIHYEINGSHIILSKPETLKAVPQTPKSEKIVSGKVFDENKAPIAGATVWIKETAISFITDVDGNYSLNISGLAAPVIQVSFLGYEDMEEVVNGRDRVNFQMKPSTIVLDDAVAVAYGTQKRESVIGSISQVTPKELRAPTANISTALAGQVSGLVSIQRSGEPGESSNFWIRGVSSLNSSSRSPLVLVDGIERSMDLVDVEDIASFSVLKDATATAVYGVKGANGVILINTKSGQQGAPKIGVRVEQGMVSPTKMPEFADAYEFCTLYNEVNGYECR